jgi:hypothetical protein
MPVILLISPTTLGFRELVSKSLNPSIRKKSQYDGYDVYDAKRSHNNQHEPRFIE